MKIIDSSIVEQRIRNRIIEMLECAASFEEVAHLGLFETINCWDDFVLPHLRESYKEPVYTLAELRSLWDIHAKWENAAAAITKDSWDAEIISKIPEWVALQKAAIETLAIFEIRGRLSEDTRIKD